MEKTDIINAYLEIRKTNNTIPDEVLDFMKDCAIQKLSLPEQEKEISCENLKALVYGRKLNDYQRSLAISEFVRLIQSNNQ